MAPTQFDDCLDTTNFTLVDACRKGRQRYRHTDETRIASTSVSALTSVCAGLLLAGTAGFQLIKLVLN